MQSEEIRQRFLTFFEKRGHAVIPSSSLVPENDPSVLFTTAGMQPLVPYLMGKEHPQGKRLVNIQKCVRTQDIDEVGDNTHNTFFEMLGNWSLGDYFKEDAIKWSYELLTSKDEGFSLDPNRLYVTVFEGDENAPRDIESFEIWKKVGIPEHRIYFMPAKNNWWSVGENGPCGPDTEMFYDITLNSLGGMSREEYLAADERQNVVEIWNDVFMEYEKKDGKVIGKLKQKNVDTGSGLERITMAVQGKNNIFETDIFSSVMAIIKNKAKNYNEQSARIISDHIRTSVFIIADGVNSSNKDRGYILRRILRRAVRFSDVLGLPERELLNVAVAMISKYSSVYENVSRESQRILSEIRNEEEKFRKTLKEGLKQFERGEDPFVLFTTYGFPFELTQELAREKGFELDKKNFQEKFGQHQELSRVGAEQKFKGGLAGHSEMEVKYHTATHLLNQALREVLGKEVSQKGSNITPERLRLDFSFTRKMTDREKKKVENLVNKKIEESLPVSYENIALEEAKNRGAIGLFEKKYGDKVRVYKVGDFSLELCGGPHVENTNVLGTFKIIKEEAISTGIRRIKAILK